MGQNCFSTAGYCSVQATHGSCALPCDSVCAWKLFPMETIVSFEGISYNLTGQASYCIVGFCSVFSLEYRF